MFNVLYVEEKLFLLVNNKYFNAGVIREVVVGST